MIETEEKLENLEVVKRNGKKVEFDGTKVALAIKKGFDSVILEDDEKKYTSKDIQKVYQAVIKKIAKEYLPNGKIKIEEVQDLIEDMLKKYNYDDVYENFSEYRKRRAAAREAFRDDKNMAKLQKKIEGLGLKSANEEDSKRENANIDGNSAMGTMLQFGSTISRAFTETYLMKKKFAEAHDNGDIHIHDMDFEAMGTTTCMQIDLNKLFKNGFSTGHGHLREPKDIMSYSALAAIAIQSNQNDQHGGQSIPAFDFYMAPGVLKTFRRQYKQAVYELLDFTDFISFVKNQTLELVENYKPDILWFDGFWLDNLWGAKEGKELYYTVKSKKKNTLLTRLSYVKGKDGKEQFLTDGSSGDYFSLEAKTVETPPYPWESCTSITYPVYAYDPNAKLLSRKELIETFNKTLCGNGNLLVNIGPKPDGSMPIEQVKRLYELSDWIYSNVDAVYKTNGGPFRPTQYIGSTYANNFIYLHLRDIPDKLQINTLDGYKLEEVKILSTGRVLDFDLNNNVYTIDISSLKRKSDIQVLALRLDKKYQFTDWLPLMR